MVRSRVALTLLLGLSSLQAMAAGLGELVSQSYIGRELAAQIRLTGALTERGIAIVVGSHSDYEHLGLPRPDIIDAVSIGEPLQDDEGWYVDVSSSESVNEMFLDLVILVRRPGARQIRHYMVLLELPAVDEPSQLPREVTERRRQSAERPRPRTASVTPVITPSMDPPEQLVSGSSYVVLPGNTLFGIASEFYGRDQMYDRADQLFELNPAAFVAGDRNRLRAGARLALPAPVAGSLEGNAEPSAQIAATPESGDRSPPDVPASPTPANGPRIKLSEPPAPVELTQQITAMEQMADPELEAQAREAELQMAFSSAEAETLRRQNVQLQERFDLLEQRYEDVLRLLELRSQGQTLEGGSGDDGVALDEGAELTRTGDTRRLPPSSSSQQLNAFLIGAGTTVVVLLLLNYLFKLISRPRPSPFARDESLTNPRHMK